MVLLVLTWEERVTNIQFVEDAAETPHVYSAIVWDTEDNLWGSVEPRLDIRINLLILKAATAEINDFDPRFIYFPQ